MQSTGQPVAEAFDAVYMGGNWPQVVSVRNGQIYQTWVGASGWTTQSTGIGVDPTVSVSAVNMGGSHPQVFTVESGLLYRTAVTSGAWTRAWTALAVAGPADAVNLAQLGLQHPLVYTAE